MRDIKFKAWNTITRTMGDPFTLQDTIERWKNTAAREIPTDGILYLQLTGLTDKKGNDIYEGDVLSVTWSGTPLPVIFIDGWYCLPVKETDDNPDYEAPIFADEVEVIGNIYENPELLEKSGDLTEI